LPGNGKNPNLAWTYDSLGRNIFPRETFPCRNQSHPADFSKYTQTSIISPRPKKEQKKGSNMKMTALMDLFSLSALRALVCTMAIGIGGAAMAQITWHTEIDSGVTGISHGPGSLVCALLNDALKCWGKNPYVGMGDGRSATPFVPTLIIPSGVSDVATGDTQICAIVHGAPLCWGRNRDGELGDGTTTERLVPTPVSSILSGASAISTGIGFTCALINHGVQCWGYNLDGELGDGSQTNSTVPVSAINTDVSALSVGYSVACAIVSGAAKCWGPNFQGQLGGGIGPNVPAPKVVIASGVTAISNGQFHTCAVVSGSVQCWGDNHWGQLGDGTTTPRRDTPVTVISEGATAVVAGAFQTCAIVHGALQCWGGSGMKSAYPNDYLHPLTVLPKADDVNLTIDGTIRVLVDGKLLCFGVCHPYQFLLFSLPEILRLGEPFTLNAPSFSPAGSAENNPYPVRFTSSTPAVCSVNGNILTPLANGTCTITADQDGDATYQRATPVTRSAEVTNLLPQEVYLTLPSPLFLKTPVTLNATTSSGLTPSFVSNTPTVCRIDNTTLTPLRLGQCSITPIQPGDAKYSPAELIPQTADVVKVPQTISFKMPTALVQNTPLKLAATASSGLPVTFTSTTPTICNLVGNALTATAKGLCTVTANQNGNEVYVVAPAVSGSVSVAGISQTIRFDMQTTIPLGTDIVLKASASSGLSVSYISSSPYTCTVSGNTLTPLHPGLCSIAANQFGNAQYSAAPTVVLNATVPQLKQSISFKMPTILAPFTSVKLTGTATSGLPLYYMSTTPAACTIAGDVLTANAAGLCTVTAYQSGSLLYDLATPVPGSVTVRAASQTISFSLPSSIPIGTQVVLTASATSGLNVILTSTTPTLCKLSGSTLTPLLPGVCTITASQPGNAQNSAAPTVTRSATVVQLKQSISFKMPTTLTPLTPVKLAGTASSSLPLSYTSTTPTVCTLLGDVLTPKAAGLCSVTANQSGNNVYSAATAVSGSVTVLAINQTISFSLPLTMPIGTPVALTASATSDLGASFASTTPAICTVSGKTLKPLLSGNCTITASQPGNAVYAAAKPVTNSTTVYTPVVAKLGFLAKSTTTADAATAVVDVTGATSGARVTFYVDDNAVCSNLALVKNAASCKLAKYPSGSHTVKVVYSNGPVSASGQAILIVTKA
jgi:hypothetical protein